MANTLTLPAESGANGFDQNDREFAAEMRAKGYKPVTRWVLDLSNPVVLENYKQQLAKLAEHQRAHPEELIELTEEDTAGWV
jgi:hypothetical protein